MSITTYTNTPGAVQSAVFSAKANGKNIFVESFQDIDYIRFAADSGSLTLEITANKNIKDYKISPTSDNVTAGTVSGNKLTITIPSVPFHCVILINGLRKVCVFADPLETDSPQFTDSNIVNVMYFVTDKTGATDQHDNIMKAIDYVCGTAGKDTLYFPDGALCGTMGMYKRIEGFKIKPMNAPAGLEIKYRVHVQSIGWQGWVQDGALAGTSGKGLRIETLQIALTGTDAWNMNSRCRALKK